MRLDVFRLLSLIPFVVLASAKAQTPPTPPLEALWYSTASEGSTQSFLAHADQITIVSPQVFAFDRTGAIHGKLDPRVVEKAKEKGVKLVPLVMNPGFDQPIMHRILTVPARRIRAIRAIAALCRAICSAATARL